MEPKEIAMPDRTPEEDLAMIRRLMEQGRETLEAGAPHYVVWGLLITGALVAQWAHLAGRLAVRPPWIWSGCVGAGWLLSMIVGARSSRRSPVRTAAGRTLMGIWVGMGVTLTLAGFVGVGTGAVAGRAMLGLTAAAIGGALFATSFVHGSKVARAVSVVWWVGAVVLFVWEGPAANLLLAGLTATLLLAPGLWMTLRGRDGGAAAAAGRGAGR